MQDNGLQALNQILDLLNSKLYTHGGGRRSAGLGMMGAAASYRGDATGAIDAANKLETSVDAKQLDALVAKVEASKGKVQLAESIAQKRAAEKAAIQSEIEEAMAPLFNDVFKDPDAAQAAFEELTADNDPEESIRDRAGLNEPPRLFEGLRLDKEEEISNSIANIVRELEEKGIDVRDGGQRIFAREMLLQHPELFGEVKGKALPLDIETPARARALDALYEFDLNGAQMLDLDEKLGAATYESEYAEQRLATILQKAKDLSLHADRVQLDAIEAELDIPDLAEDEAQVNLEEVAEAEQAATQDMRAEFAAPEAEVVEQEEVLDLAGYEEAAEEQAEQEAAQEAQAYQKVMDEEAEQAIEVEEQVIAEDNMAKLIQDPEISPAYARRLLDAELLEAHDNPKGKTFVTRQMADGTEVNMPKELVQHYDEVERKEAFEAQQPKSARDQLNILVEAEKQNYSKSNRGNFKEVTVDGEKVMVREQNASIVSELIERNQAEIESGTAQMMDIDVKRAAQGLEQKEPQQQKPEQKIVMER